MTTRRKRHRKQVFWVIDKIMADGKQRTAEAIRDEFEEYRSNKGSRRTHVPTSNQIRGLIKTEKKYEKIEEGGMTLWKMKTSYIE